MAKLLLKHEAVTLSSYKLEQDEIGIGRNPENDIQLDDAAVSGKHAKITRQPNEYLEDHFDYTIEDLGSTNGTRVNGKRISRQILKHGDTISIGGHNFVYDSGQIQDMETTAIFLPDDD